MARGAVLPNIIVDQFGYRPSANKLVIFARPVSGVGSPSTFDPGTTFNLVNAASGTTVFTGTITQWNGGAVDSASGDMAWQGDFSSYSAPGTFYIQVSGGSNPGGQSYPFQIRSDIYNGVEIASQRSFFYSRCGCDISAANGGANWNHPACHENAGQELSCDLYVGGVDQGPGTARDVHGGWHDTNGGDWSKYVSGTGPTMWFLLHSVDWYPQGYTDSTNIPESGNGVPDMLDEIKWEMDWYLRMQRSSDGALFSDVKTPGNAGPLVPSGDTTATYYDDVTDDDTAFGCMAFALGARVFGQYPYYASYAVTLRNAATAAWGYLQAQSVVSGTAVGAAAELFALTGNSTYQTYFDANYNSSSIGGPVKNPPTAGDIFDPDSNVSLQLGMVSYCLAPGATTSVVAAIKNALMNECEYVILANNPANDPYGAYMYGYWWGSNGVMAQWGDQLLYAAKLGVNPGHTSAYLAQAEEYLHYFHGRNPLNYVYLTNMGTKGANLGASQPAMSIFSNWFWQGTIYDGNSGPSAVGPAPGILSGGPDETYSPCGSGDCGGTPYAGVVISPPMNEPPMKTFKDWNNNWPDASWQVTEPDQSYQGPYQLLVSAFAASPASTPAPSPTRSMTPSPTASSTNTSTPTPSGTASPTASRTATGTSTLSMTPTFSPTPTITATMIASSTPTPVLTDTATPIASSTGTATSSPSQTPTSTNTATLTATPTNSATSSATPTVSDTVTNTPVYSFTPTHTSTNSATSTTSGTPTFTATVTRTFTPTNTVTMTDSFTPTSTGTFTHTFTSTFTLTLTDTPTSSMSPTATASQTPTSTSTMTGTATLTASRTATWTWTPTPTSSPTATWSPTPTLSPTSTQSFTPTPTITPVPESFPVVYPNPADGTVPVKVRPPAYFGVSDVKVRVFTIAFRKAQENTYRQVPAGTDVPLSLTDKWGKPLASGLYYVVVQTSQGRTIGKLLILR